MKQKSSEQVCLSQDNTEIQTIDMTLFQTLHSTTQCYFKPLLIYLKPGKEMSHKESKVEVVHANRECSSLMGILTSNSED